MNAADVAAAFEPVGTETTERLQSVIDGAENVLVITDR